MNHSWNFGFSIWRGAAVAALAVMMAMPALADEPETYNYMQGQRKIAEEKYDEAITYFERELAENPKNGYAYAGLITAYAGKQEYGPMLDAASMAERYIPKKDKQYVAYVAKNKAWLHCQYGDTVKALETLNNAIRITDNDADLFDLRGDIYSALKQWDKSDADYHRAIKLTANNSNYYYGLAFNAFKQELYDKALTHIEQALSADPDFVYNYYLRGAICEQRGQWGQMTDDVCKSLELEAYNYFAMSVIKTIEEPAFSMLANKFVQRKAGQPDNTMWSYMLGAMHFFKEDYNTALEHFGYCARLSPSANIYRIISDCHKEMGDYAAAIRAIERAMAYDVDNIDIKIQHADLLYNSGNPQAAIRELETLKSEADDNADVFYNCGWYKFMTGDYDGAIKDLSRAIELHPDYSYALVNRGNAYTRLGKYDLARLDYRKAIDLEEEDGVYKSAFYAYLGLGYRDKAIAALDALLAGSRDKGNLYEAVCLYSRMGQTEKAFEYLQECLDKGQREFAHMRLDPDLKTLRDDPRFERLLSRYERHATDEIMSEDELKGGVATAFGSSDRDETATAFGSSDNDKTMTAFGSSDSPGSQSHEPMWIFSSVEQNPEFPGGQAALMRFLSENIIYPAEAGENGKEGRVVVQFVVEKDGSVGEVKVVRGVDPLLDAEAVRVCKSLPHFKPGRQNGQPVRVWFTLPITFKLSAPKPAENNITQ